MRLPSSTLWMSISLGGIGCLALQLLLNPEASWATYLISLGMGGFLGGGLAWGAVWRIQHARKPKPREEEPLDPNIQWQTGVVKWFNPSKGFGFIAQEHGNDVFVHRTEIFEKGLRSLNKDDRVQFELSTGKKGPIAKKVRKILIQQENSPSIEDQESPSSETQASAPMR